MTAQDRLVKISKALSYLLRHGAIKEHLNIDSNGFVSVKEILQHQRLKSFKTTVEDIQSIVDTNDKQRFTLKTIDNELMIGANQGHSIAVSNDIMHQCSAQELSTLQLFHGTYQSKLPSIWADGLRCMNRNHIHLTDNINYVRKSCNLLIYIDINACLHQGMVFYKSENNVYLTLGINGTIDHQYFHHLTDKQGTTVNPPS